MPFNPLNCLILITRMLKNNVQKISVTNLFNLFGKNHGIKKKLIEREGESKALRWDGSDLKNVRVVWDRYSPPPQPHDQVQEVTFSDVSERHRREVPILDICKHFFDGLFVDDRKIILSKVCPKGVYD